MSSESHHEPADQANYERRDVHLTALTGFLIFLIVFMVASLIIGVVLHKGYLRIERSRKVDVNPMADLRRTPPAPRLQVDPTKDRVDYKARQDSILSTYSWVDAQQGVVQLPIERAKQLIAERGL